MKSSLKVILALAIFTLASSQLNWSGNYQYLGSFAAGNVYNCVPPPNSIIQVTDLYSSGLSDLTFSLVFGSPISSDCAAQGVRTNTQVDLLGLYNYATDVTANGMQAVLWPNNNTILFQLSGNNSIWILQNGGSLPGVSSSQWLGNWQVNETYSLPTTPCTWFPCLVSFQDNGKGWMTMIYNDNRTGCSNAVAQIETVYGNQGGIHTPSTDLLWLNTNNNSITFENWNNGGGCLFVLTYGGSQKPVVIGANNLMMSVFALGLMTVMLAFH
jgi:hypothetical protein